METKLLLCSGWKFALQPIILAALTSSLILGGAATFTSQKSNKLSSPNGPQTPEQKAQLLARVVHDVDIIKNS